MNLNMHILMDELSEFHPTSYLDSSVCLTIHTVELFSNTSDIFQPEKLYLIDNIAWLPGDGRLKGANLLCIGAADREFAEENCCNVIFVPENITITMLINRIFNIQKAYDEWNNRMLTSTILKRPMKDFFDIVLEKIRYPIVLMGPMDTLLYSAGERSEGYKDSVWEELLDKGYLSYEHPILHEFLNKAYQHHKERDVFIVNIPNHKYSYLTANIFFRGKKCGVIQLLGAENVFTLGQVTLVTYVKGILEQAIKDIPDFQILSSRDNSFVYQMLKHVYLKESIIENSLKVRGWKVFDEYYCLIFRYDVRKREKEILQSILIQELSRMFPLALIVDYKNDVVIISRNYDFTYDMEGLKRKLEVIAEKFSVISGISSKFYDFKELKKYYDECNLAIKYGKEISPNARIHFFEDYIINHLTRFIFVENGRNQFINSRVELLHRYDLRNGTEFVKTLLTYLIYGQSKSLAAEKMHLHRNSLVYRLNTIYKLSGIDCNSRIINENEIFHIMLSCKFLQCEISKQNNSPGYEEESPIIKHE